MSELGHSHLSILGDFGSGKTWFCQHYAYLAAKRHLGDPVQPRLELLAGGADRYVDVDVARVLMLDRPGADPVERVTPRNECLRRLLVGVQDPRGSGVR